MKRLTLHICHLETESKRFYIILALILLLVVIFFLFNKGWGLSDDVWETAAAIREISTNPLQPNNPILALQGSTSPRFVPYVIFWGLFKKVTSADIFLTIGIAAIMNYLIIMTGLFRLVSILFKNKAMPVYVMITMLMVWGKGYGWANAYQFELFIENIPHVGFFTFGLTMHALYYLARFFKKKKWPDFLLYSLFSVIVFITHPITGLFCFVAAFALEFTHEKFWKVVLWQSIPAIAVALSFIWPYFKYWDVFLQGTQNEWFQSSLFSNQILALGPSLLGFPIAIYYGLKKKNRFLIYGLSLCSFIYLFSAVTEIKIGGRFGIIRKRINSEDGDRHGYKKRS